MSSLPPELLLKIASHLPTRADFAHFSQVDKYTHGVLDQSLEAAADRTSFVQQAISGLNAAKSFTQILPWVSRAVAMLTGTDAPRTAQDNELLAALLGKLSNHNSWMVPETEKQAALDVAAKLAPLAASMTRREARHYSDTNARIHDCWRQTALALMGSAVPGQHAARMNAIATSVPPGSHARMAETNAYLKSLTPGSPSGRVEYMDRVARQAFL